MTENRSEQHPGEAVKVYSSDTGHSLGPLPHEEGFDEVSHPEGGRLREGFARVGSECRKQMSTHPWSALGVAALAGVLAGALLTRRIDRH